MAQESWDRDPNSHDAMAMASSKAEKPLPSSSLISDQSPNPNPNPNPTTSAIPNSNSTPNSGPIPNNFNPNPNPNPHNRSAVSPSRPFHTQSVHLPTSGEMFLSRQMIQERGPGSCGSVAGMPQESMSRCSMSRCSVCKKRTGLLGFKCRCGGGVFCVHHRHSDKHACPFDYRLAARIAIAKANPLILAPKLHKI